MSVWRPFRVTLLFGLALAYGLTLATAALAEQLSVMSVAGIGMTVSEMDRSVAFYSDVLTFKKISDVEVDVSDVDLRRRACRRPFGGGGRQEVVEIKWRGYHRNLTMLPAPV